MPRIGLRLHQRNFLNIFLSLDNIQNCPIDCRKTLYENIVLSGGTTMFAGFPTRLENEIVNLYKTVIQKNADVDIPFDIEVKVIFIKE